MNTTVTVLLIAAYVLLASLAAAGMWVLAAWLHDRRNHHMSHIDWARDMAAIHADYDTYRTTHRLPGENR